MGRDIHGTPSLGSRLAPRLSSDPCASSRSLSVKAGRLAEIKRGDQALGGGSLSRSQEFMSGQIGGFTGSCEEPSQLWRLFGYAGGVLLGENLVPEQDVTPAGPTHEELPQAWTASQEG